MTQGVPPGWYPDPWLTGHFRYWDGEVWTGNSFPGGPATADDAPTWPASPAPGPAPVTSTVPPPPDWSHTAWTGAPDPPTQILAVGPPPRRRPSGGQLTAIAIVIALVVGLTVGLITGHDRSPVRAAAPTLPAAPANPTVPVTPSSPTVPATPVPPVLTSIVVRQADVAPDVTVRLLASGRDTSTTATLDVCNGTFPSESKRESRLQVAAVDTQASPVLSTEAVLYTSPGATAQAFTELRSVAAACPATPVTSPVGEPTVATRFNPAPDGSWPATPTVERLAFDFTTTDATGPAQHSVAVYLRRGRVLLGIYFPQPDGAQSPVAGASTIPGIVTVFAQRIAALAASTVG